jgi:CheY-like chemotaxis protein
MMKMLLELWAYLVEMAEDAPEGVAKARLFRPRVALIDIGLPGLNGYQVAQQIRSEADGGDIFLIALTGYSHLENRRYALEVGFDLFLIKPVNPEELSGILSRRGRKKMLAAV